MKKLILSVMFIFTALFSSLNHSIYSQAVNTVELETLNQGQVKNIIRVNSENELPKDGTTYTLVYSKQHCKLPDEPEKTSEVTTGTSQNTTTVTSQEVTTTFTSILKNQVKQSLPQTGTQKSVTVVLTAGVLVGLAFLMIRYHKKKVWMVLLITASVTSLYNLRNVMAQNETKVTTTTVTTFVPTSDHCLYGYIIIPNISETTKSSTEKGQPEILDKPEFTTEKGQPEFTTEKGVPETQSELPEYVGTSTEATVTTATTTTSTEPTTTVVTSAEPIFESSEVESTEDATTTEATSSTTSTNSK